MEMRRKITSRLRIGEREAGAVYNALLRKELALDRQPSSSPKDAQSPGIPLYAQFLRGKSHASTSKFSPSRSPKQKCLAKTSVHTLCVNAAHSRGHNEVHSQKSGKEETQTSFNDIVQVFARLDNDANFARTRTLFKMLKSRETGAPNPTPHPTTRQNNQDRFGQGIKDPIPYSRNRGISRDE